MTNQRIATMFEDVADLLAQQEASPHRVRAWRDAAVAIREHPREMTDVFRDHGRVGLEAVPHVGRRLAVSIIELIRSGRLAVLDRLRGDPIGTITRVPGIGRKLAERVHRQLCVETLEDLEVAAHDGRLARVAGFGPRKVAAVRDVLATRLSDAARARARRPPQSPLHRTPSVGALLEIDRRYREAAAAGTLPRIAPKRFNPGHEAWLPVLHADVDGWSYTALFSNTALAHQLGRTDDWVVIYFHEPAHTEEQATVVTERGGLLRGRRVVRGREAECRMYYAASAA
jgi:hypothetical protein